MRVLRAVWNFFLDMFDPWEDTPGRAFYVILLWVLVLVAIIAVGIAAISGAI